MKLHVVLLLIAMVSIDLLIIFCVFSHAGICLLRSSYSLLSVDMHVSTLILETCGVK